MQRRIVLGAAASALALGAAGIVVVQRGRDGGPPPPLRLAAIPPNSNPEGQARPFTFESSPDLPALGGEAPAYRWGDDPGRAEVEELAEVFGIEGEITDRGSSLEIEGAELTLNVGGGIWDVYRAPPMPEAPGSGTAVLEGDEPVPGPSPNDEFPVPLDPGQATPVAGLPSEDEAREIGLETLEAVGVDTDGAAITVIGGTTQWEVSVELRVGGLLALDLATSVMVGAGGRIESASGTIAEFEKLGDYPLVDTGAAADRLNDGWLDGVPLDDLALTGRGNDLLVTDAEVVLVNATGWDRSQYLVPAYKLATEDEGEHAAGEQTVLAVAGPLIDPGLVSDADGASATGPDHPGMEVTARLPVVAPLHRCGIDDVWLDSQRWQALDPPFDATNAPAEYLGEGEIEPATGVYTDESGITVQFTRVEWDQDPPPCD